MAFNSVGNLHPRRSGFNLSYSKTFCADMGYLYPVMADEVVPGDVFKISADWLIRANPLVAPIMAEIDAQVHYFFVPYRLLWTDWENFITGGRDGDFESEIPYLKGTLNVDTVCDFLGFPCSKTSPISVGKDNDPLKINAFPALAVNFIWNEYYRDENFQPYKKYYIDTHFDGVLTDDDKFLSRYGCINKLDVPVGSAAGAIDALPLRNWMKDYFTSSLFSRQRGPAVALPISGVLPVNFSTVAGVLYGDTYLYRGADKLILDRGQFVASGSPVGVDMLTSTQSTTGITSGSYLIRNEISNAQLQSNLRGTVNLNQALTFNISDLRLATQIQKWQERNMRAGIRYTEFLRAHFGVAPSDARLDRPEYIGSAKAPIVVSEVLQTSSTDQESPQGNMAGHGISVAAQRIGNYRADEFGVIVGLFSIMPKPKYDCQGVNRQWLRQTNKDYYFPEFANLSEQAVYEAEIVFRAGSSDDSVFGYQGAYDEMRTKNDMCCGYMRTLQADFSPMPGSLSYWTLNRSFGAPPNLNSDFIECHPRKDFLAVPSEPAFIVTFGNGIKAWRPMPEIAEPGLMDHH